MFKIYTLGNFDIKYNEQSILDKEGYPYRTLKLFKYFLTHEGKPLLPENIIYDVSGEYEYKDPGGALRTQISRVRKMIDLEKTTEDNFFRIEYVNGYYKFQLEKNCTLDIKEFEEKIKILDCEEISKEEKEILINTMNLYQGTYLPELENEDWILPVRNRIDRLYIKALGCFLGILKEKIKYDEIISICEEAIQHNFYEESIHLCFLDALMTMGQKKYAESHYEFYTTKFYHELGVAPSKEAREIYKKLSNYEELRDK